MKEKKDINKSTNSNGTGQKIFQSVYDQPQKNNEEREYKVPVVWIKPNYGSKSRGT